MTDQPKLPFVQVTVRMARDGHQYTEYSGAFPPGEYYLIPKHIVQVRVGEPPHAEQEDGAQDGPQDGEQSPIVSKTGPEAETLAEEDHG